MSTKKTVKKILRKTREESQAIIHGRQTEYATMAPMMLFAMGFGIVCFYAYSSSIISPGAFAELAGITTTMFNIWTVVGLGFILLGGLFLTIIGKWYEGKVYFVGSFPLTLPALSSEQEEWFISEAKASMTERFTAIFLIMILMILASLTVASKTILGISANVTLPVVLFFGFINFGLLLMKVRNNALSLSSEGVVSVNKSGQESLGDKLFGSAGTVERVLFTLWFISVTVLAITKLLE